MGRSVYHSINQSQGGDLWRVESLRAAPLGGDGGGDAARRRRGRRDGARGGRRRAARTGAQFNRHFGDVPSHVWRFETCLNLDFPTPFVIRLW